MNTLDQLAPLYTAAEAADILRVSKRTLERWRAEGRGPAFIRLHEKGRPMYTGKAIAAFVMPRASIDNDTPERIEEERVFAAVQKRHGGGQ